jgi:hypothetical protein
MERVLMTWERQILRKYMGQHMKVVAGKIKMNQEIYNKFKWPDIVNGN